MNPISKPFGVCICGLNGSGKTTLGKMVAEASDLCPMDIENYYFRDTDHSYSSPRSREEVRKLLMEDIQRTPRFVLSAVNGDMGDEINAAYRVVVYLSAPSEIRMERVRKRAYDKFGSRVMGGGDLYEQEQAFLDFVAKRSPDRIEQWLRTLSCPILRLDATRKLESNLNEILLFLTKYDQNR